MLDRRRALSSIQVEEQLPSIKDIPVGSDVRFLENGAAWIYCGVQFGNAQILRDLVYSSSNKKTALDYRGSNPDNYLLNTILPSFSAAQQAIMRDSTFDIQISDGSATSKVSMTRKIYCPDWTQIKNGGTFFTAFYAYKHTSSANTARQAMDSGGTYRAYWSCWAYNATTVGAIAASGSTGGSATSSTLTYIRPVVSLDKDTKVRLVNGVYILQY